MGQEGRDVADAAMMEGVEDEQLERHCRIWTYGSKSHGMKLTGVMSSSGKPTKGRWVPKAHTKPSTQESYQGGFEAGQHGQGCPQSDARV